MRNLTLEEMQFESYATAKEKGWHDEGMERSFVEELCLVHSELSEALEDYRNGHQVSKTFYEEAASGYKKPCGIPSELADVIIRLGDMAERWGINLTEAVREKMEYNKTRSVRHGGRLL